MRNTRSRRHQKNLSHDPKDGSRSENVGKVGNAHSDHEKAEAVDDLSEAVMDRVEIGIGEENGVDRKG